VPVAQGAKEAAVKTRVICDWAVRPDVGEATNIPAGPSYPEGAPLTVISGVGAERELAALAAHWPAAHAVSAAGDVTAALAGLRLPVVAKAEAGLAHRAASGGVLRGLSDPRAVTLAVELLLERFGGKVELVEEVPHDAELTLGFQRDARNGPLLMFGLGGADVGDAVEFRVLPLSDGQIDALLGRYLDSTAERAAVAELIRTFQVHVLAHPEVASVDLNPFVLRDDDVVLLDAKIHVATGG
jgi:acetyltransferase